MGKNSKPSRSMAVIKIMIDRLIKPLSALKAMILSSLRL